jgi:hypothetical protein
MFKRMLSDECEEDSDSDIVQQEQVAKNDGVERDHSWAYQST